MQRVGAGRVELAVLYTGAGRHSLNFIWTQRFLMPHAVFVNQRTLGYVSQNLHVAMAVHSESAIRSDAVFVDDRKGPKTHEVRIGEIGERERVVRVEPPMICVAPVITFADLYHFKSPFTN